MRHLHSGRKLGRAPHHRRATLRALTLALIENESIQTMPSRAKELRWFADRAVTLAKRGDVAGRRLLVKMLGSTQTFVPGENRVRNAVEKVYSDYVPRFKDRQGGYTQMFRLATRRAGDNAEMCVMRYIPAPEEKKAKQGTKEAKTSKEPKKKTAAPAVEDKPVSKKADKKEDAPSDKKPKAKKKE